MGYTDVRVYHYAMTYLCQNAKFSSRRLISNIICVEKHNRGSQNRRGKYLQAHTNKHDNSITKQDSVRVQ